MCSVLFLVCLYFCVCECLLQVNLAGVPSSRATFGFPQYCASTCVRFGCTRNASCVDATPKPKTKIYFRFLLLGLVSPRMHASQQTLCTVFIHCFYPAGRPRIEVGNGPGQFLGPTWLVRCSPFAQSSDEVRYSPPKKEKKKERKNSPLLQERKKSKKECFG